MSHLFISYAHNDQRILEKVVSWIEGHKNNKIKLWYDNNIDGGRNWRDEISQALDSAFAMIVIVTSSSNQSIYCTYEWAYAMGQGLPVIPLTFEKLTITDILPPLASKQIIDCTDAIPEHLYEHIRQLESPSPQLEMINRQVFEIIYETHKRFFILGWIGKDAFGYFSNDDFKEDTLGYFIEQSTKASTELENIILNNSIAMTSKQYRHCWKIADFLKQFSQLHRKYDNYLYDYLFTQFDSEWLPSFEYFEGDGYWNRWTRKHFKWAIDKEDKSQHEIEVIVEIVRAFPNVYGDQVELIIHNTRVKQNRN